MGVVTVDGAHSTWNAPSVSESLCVGYNGNGMMTITNGGTVNDQRASCSIGSGSASTGTVAVDGAGSTWSSYEAIDVGGRGNATLNVTNGGVVTSQSGLLGNMTGLTGSATISGSGSTWTATLGVTVGGAGDGKLRIDGGGTVNSPSDVPGAAASYIAQGYNSMSTVAVDGAGSTWTNGANLSIGAAGTGTLSITGDGAVTAASLSIGSTSLAAIDVGRCSSLTVGGGTGAITNNRAVRILAGAGVPTGGNYRPISAGTWGGSGTVQAVGGTWNAGSQQFTASAVVPATSGTPVQFDLSRQQRALISDAATGWSVGASFLASSSSKPLDFVATTVSGSTLTALEGLLPAKQSVVGAWSFLATSGYESGDPAYLSFQRRLCQRVGGMAIQRHQLDTI